MVAVIYTLAENTRLICSEQEKARLLFHLPLRPRLSSPLTKGMALVQIL